MATTRVITDPGIAPRYPVMPSDGKMACVMTPQGLRLAGQVELAGLDAAPNWQRAAVLRDFARRVFPDLPRDLPADEGEGLDGPSAIDAGWAALHRTGQRVARTWCMRLAMAMSG